MLGKFISFEGTEGVGKTTQIQQVATALTAHGYEVIITREPGGSPGAEQIRELLLNGAINKWDGLTEALLNFAARRNHITTVIQPALAAGKIVLCDRFYDSTIAYQAFGHGVELAKIQQLISLSIDDFSPDLTLLLSLPVEEGLARTQTRGEQNRYEAMELAFHRKVAQGFQWVAEHYPQRVAVVEVSGLAISEVTDKLLELILAKLAH